MRIYIDYPDNSEFDNTPNEKILYSFTQALLLKKKYQILYCLRSIEDELNNSDGIILVRDGSEFEFKNFPQDLIDKILLLHNQGEQAGYFE